MHHQTCEICEIILFMKKIIKEYEERNRVISQIQKNLRVSHFKHQKAVNLPKQQKSLVNYKSLDLPMITKKSPYFPKSHANSSTIKKQSENQPENQSPSPKSKPWIQTITFKAEGEGGDSPPVIIFNNRTTMKNFLRTTQRQKIYESSFSPKKDASHQTIDHSIFLSPRKVPHQSRKNLNKSKKRVDSYIKNLTNQKDQNQQKSFFDEIEWQNSVNPHNTGDQTGKIGQIMNDNPYSTKQSMQKEQEAHIKIGSIPYIGEKQIRKIKIKNKQKLKGFQQRICSPWNAELGQSNNEIWEF